MCLEFWRALERMEEMSLSESPTSRSVRAEGSEAPVGSRKTEWSLPADPVQACAWSPA